MIRNLLKKSVITSSAIAIILFLVGFIQVALTNDTDHWTFWEMTDYVIASNYIIAGVAFLIIGVLGVLHQFTFNIKDGALGFVWFQALGVFGMLVVAGFGILSKAL